MAYLPVEQMDLFGHFEEVAGWAWKLVADRNVFAQQTLGGQLIRSVDSINANIVEGDGRGSDPDALRFFVIARASAREARLWVVRAADRALCPQEEADHAIGKLTEGVRMLNGLISYRRQSGAKVKEDRQAYAVDPALAPFLCEDGLYAQSLTPNA